MAAKIWSVVCMAPLYPAHQSTHLHAAQSRLHSSVSAGYSVGGDVASYSSTRHSRAQLYVGMGMSMAGVAIILIF